MNGEQGPYTKCSFCGMGVTCEHGKCQVCQRCKKCEREGEIWNDIGLELKRMGEEEPGW